MTPASDRRRLISSNRSSNFSSLRRMESFIGANYSGRASMPVAFFDQQPCNRRGEVGIRQFSGLAQGLRRRVQQTIRQGVGQILDDFVGRLTRGQQAPGLFYGLQPNPLRLLTQRTNGGGCV